MIKMNFSCFFLVFQRDLNVLSHSVVSDSLGPHGLYPARLLCPWDFSGKNTGVSCHFLLQGISPTQGSNRVSRVCRIGRQILTISATWEALVSWLNYLLTS